MKNVDVRIEKVVIPTYEIADYDKNPMFLEKRVYQGSSGRVYPHPVCEGVSDVKVDKEYTAIFLENKYILVMILPEIGGRIQRLYDKTNRYDAVYYNEVIKPALVGLAGPWISGGIEFNWPQHHRPSTFDPVDYTISKNVDGSVTVWVGEIEKMFHTKGMAGFSVYPDKAYLEIKGQVYNPTDVPQTFLWWANPAVAVNDDTQSIFPTDVTAVMDHGKRDVSKFPIADGVYYKVDYAPGTDISRYKNIPVPTSYMAYHSDYDFIGNYDYGKNAGLLHIADHHVSPGKKQWTWGNGDFGRAWDRNLTDENGPYIELMTGMFTDNQPDFTYLKPHEEKTFVQYFMPYKAVGAIKNASTQVAINIEKIADNLEVKAYSPIELGNIRISLIYDINVILTEEAYLTPVNVFSKEYAVSDLEKILIDKIGSDVDSDWIKSIELRVEKDRKTVLSYKSATDSTNTEPIAAKELPIPSEIDTTEKLFLAATHLEQYRHATYSPQDYYEEGLKRDASDIRLNNGYGKYLYNKGYFHESEKYFKAAIKSATWKNPNPYDCEPYYNLGLSLKMQGKYDEAYDAFYKAVWDGNMQDKAYYQLACMEVSNGNICQAVEFVEKSLVKGMHNLNARTLKLVLLRMSIESENDKKAAIEFAKDTLKIDALNYAAYYELYKLTGEGYEKFKQLMRGDNHNYIELALVYRAVGLYDEVTDILRMADNDDEPMLHYYLYESTKDMAELEKAERATSLYCFPNRLDDIVVLKNAINNCENISADYARYYLGNLYYDRGRWQDSVELWERCAAGITLPTVHRNLSLAYYNKLHDIDKAKASMEKAFAMDKSDVRVFFELDQLYKILNYDYKYRLDNMNKHIDILEKRDDLYTEYITLLNMDRQYEKAYNCIMNHNFHPWEGGEGKIPAQYRKALINMAQNTDNRENAIGLLHKALVYPYNLGEGKLIGNLDNDIYYMLGNLYEDAEKSTQAYRLASRGNSELTSAMYYNDQPPEMMYYAAKAIGKLGNIDEEKARYQSFIRYADEHMDDKVKIDYFAVSLPDFLIFEADLDKKNKVHCKYMAALGYMGLDDKENLAKTIKEGLSMDKSHAGMLDLMYMCEMEK